MRLLFKETVVWSFTDYRTGMMDDNNTAFKCFLINLCLRKTKHIKMFVFSYRDLMNDYDDDIQNKYEVTHLCFWSLTKCPLTGTNQFNCHSLYMKNVDYNMYFQIFYVIPYIVFCFSWVIKLISHFLLSIFRLFPGGKEDFR